MHLFLTSILSHSGKILWSLWVFLIFFDLFIYLFFSFFLFFCCCSCCNSGVCLFSLFLFISLPPSLSVSSLFWYSSRLYRSFFCLIMFSLVLLSSFLLFYSVFYSFIINFFFFFFHIFSFWLPLVFSFVSSESLFLFIMAFLISLILFLTFSNTFSKFLCFHFCVCIVFLFILKFCHCCFYYTHFYILLHSSLLPTLSLWYLLPFFPLRNKPLPVFSVLFVLLSFWCFSQLHIPSLFSSVLVCLNFLYM